MKINKSFLTNLICLILTILGYFYSHIIYMIGIFGLSGGITNWIAIHMLFEKVPFLYGSGIITMHFEEFKSSIRKLIIKEFFNENNLSRFSENNENFIDFTAFTDNINFNKIFDKLKDAIAESPMGNMLKMFGGKEALEPLRESVILKLDTIIEDILTENKNKIIGKEFINKFILKIELIIDHRMDELTPETVKKIIQDMIREHLGWLVVWGGVFGGLIGLTAGIIK